MYAVEPEETDQLDQYGLQDRWRKLGLSKEEVAIKYGEWLSEQQFLAGLDKSNLSPQEYVRAHVQYRESVVRARIKSYRPGA